MIPFLLTQSISNQNRLKTGRPTPILAQDHPAATTVAPKPPFAPRGRSLRVSHHEGESAQPSIDKMAQE
jgi:hypothetical protein